MKHLNLFLYGDTPEKEYLDIMQAIADSSFEASDCVDELVSKCIGRIVEISEKMGFCKNIWNAYIAYVISNHENAFSTSCERRGYIEGGINDIAKLDFDVFRKLMITEADSVDVRYRSLVQLLMNFKNNNESEKYYNKRIRDALISLSDSLSQSQDTEHFFDTVCDFYKNMGVGKFGMFKAFRLSDEKIKPVISIEHIRFDDLIGYEIQKKKLVDNTEAFLQGKKANNVLLFGDSGTGKSSSIKALLNEYYDAGLRMIEVYKHQFEYLSAIINEIKDRNYKFIIYMDDLSFEEFEIEYKYLKAVIEGGLEKKPDNVLIYATSNRRHLVREKYSDKEEREDDLHTRDTVQEKLSLSARFGVSIFYGTPDKKQFTEIVKGLAERNKLDIDEATLLLEANKWELSHGGLSGRTAEQFINYLSFAYRNE